MDLSGFPIVDHHAHPFIPKASTHEADAYRAWFTESEFSGIHERHTPNSIFYRTAIRWLAELLDCEPSEEAVTTARAAVDEQAWITRLISDANIDVLLSDYGFGGTEAYSHEQMQDVLPCRVEPILRLETLAEDLLLESYTFQDMVDRFVAKVEAARSDGYVCLKSIIAYRTGLWAQKTPYTDALAAYEEIKPQADRSGSVRLANKPLNDYLLRLALDIARRIELPVQIHTGFGDSDADLRGANPIQFRDVIEEYSDVQLVLLHAGWPYYREMAHLAGIYPNVWADLSLAIPFATAGIPTMLRDMIGMAPYSKLMFATDAFTMPDIYWLAARWGRWGLSRVLDELVLDGLLLSDEADEAATMILSENARQLYLG